MKYDERACKFNMDTGCVELLLRDGREISIDCTGVEDALDVTMAQRSELDYLIYNDPLGYADLILNGDPEEYLKKVAGSHGYSDEIGIIYIEARIEGEELIISVRDEGKGILDVEKAMEPMYTTDTTGERSGMGFSFMEAFMDEVEVESKVGCGTCVTMKKRIGRGYMNKEQEEKETAEFYG